MTWFAFVTCSDCTGIDCFDGGDEMLGPFDTEAEAVAAGDERVANVGHYYLVEVSHV